MITQVEIEAKLPFTPQFAGMHYDEPEAIAIEECECCNCYHRVEFHGDCRSDNERFGSPEQAEAQLGKPTFETFKEGNT